jgi:hypothetical protein
VTTSEVTKPGLICPNLPLAHRRAVCLDRAAHLEVHPSFILRLPVRVFCGAAVPNGTAAIYAWRSPTHVGLGHTEIDDRLIITYL